MKKKYIFIILILVSLLATVLTQIACDNSCYKKGTIYALSTYIDIEIYASDETICEETYTYVEKIYKDINKLADSYTEYEGINNIYTINNTNEEVIIDTKLFDLLKYAVYYQETTNGYFNPFMGDLNNLYKDIINKVNDISNIELEEKIKIELNKTNNTKLVFNKEKLSVRRIGEGKIDLGAIAKGYATQLAKEYLLKNGITEYLINAGASSIALGEKNNSSYYNVGINSIDNVILKVKNRDIGTSSILEQLITYNETTYHHIINPYTGKPENYYDIVTIIGKDSILLDAFSTAMMSMSLEEIKSFSETMEINVILYKDNKLLYASKKENIYG